MEVAGLVLAGPAVVAQLLQVSIGGYKVFSQAQSAGTDINRCQHALDIQRERLEDWVRKLATLGGNLSNIVGSNTKRYQVILETLVLIAEVFTQVEQLETKYGIRHNDIILREVNPTQSSSLAKIDFAVRRRKRDIFRGAMRGVWSPDAQEGDSIKHRAESTKLSVGPLRKLAASSVDLSVQQNTSLVKRSHETGLELAVPGIRDEITRIEKKKPNHIKRLFQDMPGLSGCFLPRKSLRF